MSKRSLSSLLFVIVVLGMLVTARAQTVPAYSELPATLEPTSSKIEAVLLERFATELRSDFIVRFVEQADLSQAYNMDWDARGKFVYNILKETARRTQGRAIKYLETQGLKHQTFIAGNELYVWAGNLTAANALAALPEVESIRMPRTYHIDPLTASSPIIGTGLERLQTPQATIAWGISDTKADQFWATYGIKGQGIVVANIDTGVQWNHPALVDQFKCPGDPTNPACWMDPSNICGAGGACDNNGHGTHTMGTMVAKDDPGFPYIAGMAPNAQWIACKGCESNSCSEFALNSCADWILAPGGDPANRPHIVNNSWGGGGGNAWYLSRVNAWRAAGIFPAFSAGNSGPGCGTLGSPGDYQESFGSAAHDSSRNIASFSSRGPSSFGHDPYTKPNISAPGVNVCSTVPTNGWRCYNGTSMASPHTAGAVALLWSCNASLRGQITQTFELLQGAADTPPAGNCGAPPDGEGNYTYGYGYLNVLAAGMQTCGDSTLTGMVTDADTSDPIAGARVQASSSPTETYAAFTNAGGVYEMRLWEGVYTVTASAFGYQPATVSGVVVTSGLTTTLDIALTAANWYNVSGVVYDTITGWPLYARISIGGYPGPAIWTDPATGYYSISLPEGIAYTFNATAWVKGYHPKVIAVGPLTGDETVDIALDADLLACEAPGYTSATVWADDFDPGGFSDMGWTVVNNGGDCVWRDDNPGGRINNTGGSGRFAIADSDYCGSGSYMDTELLSPPFDVSGMGTVVLEFKSDYPYLWTAADILDVDVYNGSVWTNVLRRQGVAYPGPETVRIDITAAAGGATDARVRFHYYNANWEYWWSVDDVKIRGVCVPPTDGGLVVGNVYDANTLAALTGAKVSGEEGYTAITQATPDDTGVDDGFYTLFASSGDRVFTATMDLYIADVETVAVVNGDTVRQDFYLPAGNLIVDPDSLHAVIDLGSIETLTLDLQNLGSGLASWEMKEVARGWSPARVRIPAFTGRMPASKVPASTEMAPEMPAPVGESAVADWVSLLEGRPAFALDIWPGRNLVYIPDSTTPGSWNVIAPVSQFHSAGDFLNGDFSKMYALDYDSNEFVTIDTATGARTVIAATSPSGKWTGLTGAADGTLYATSSFCGTSSTLYKINPATGALTTIGQITNAPCIIDIAINIDGEMYGVDIVNDVLVRIDPTTGAGTVVGPLGIDANYAQGLDFEEESGVLYWAAFNRTANRGELRIIDTTTGASTLVGAFPGGAEVDCLAFATVGFVDVPWLSESPISGTLPTGGDQTVDVTFDASVPEVTQPGDYYAQLRIRNDTPYGPLAVPVTMTVNVPATWGKLEGTVRGLGYCDANPAPLKEAEIEVYDFTGMLVVTLTTDAQGRYSYWLDEAHSPLTVTVTHPDHQTDQATGVTITAQQTTTVDFNLRWLRPCLSETPPNMSVMLDMGMSTTLQMTLTNAGAADANFEIKEGDRGWIPAAQATPMGTITWLYRSTEGVPMETADGTKLAYPGAYRFTPARASLQQQGKILIYTDDWWHTSPNTYPEQAIARLGWPATIHVDGDYAGFEASLNNGGPWDVVIWSGENFAIPDSTLTALVNYVQNGGRLAATYWRQFSIPTHPLWTEMGFTYISNYLDTPPAYWWNPSHPIFTTPESAPEWITRFARSGNSQGTRIEPLANGIAVAGYTLTPAVNEAAIVIRNDGNTVYKAIRDLTTDADDDGDGVADGVELWENIMFGLMFGFGVDVPWLSEYPVSGTVAADGGMQVVNVTFDASVPEITQPGQYQAMVLVNTNDPVHRRYNIPATMTVNVPATWGKLEGTVRGLGYCDANPAPLKEAEIEVYDFTGMLVVTLTTDAQGRYSYWLDEARSPLTVTATYADHQTGQVTGIIITAQQTTTVDFDLRWLRPCLSEAPPNMSVTLDMGMSTTLQMTLTNTGAADADFELIEIEGGFRPAWTPAPVKGFLTTVAPGDYAPSFTQLRSLGTHAYGGIVAVFKDANPWGTTEVEQFLAANSIPYEVHTSSEFGTLDFSGYDMIVFSGDQPQSFYNAYASYVTKFEEYVEEGGFLNFFSCDSGWNGGKLTATLPGGMQWVGRFENYNVIDDETHPVVQGVPNPFHGNYASHGHFTNLPPAAHIIASEQNGGQPTIVEYPLGRGWFIAFGQPLEISHSWGWDAGLIMENTLLWGYAFEVGGDVPWLSEYPLTGTVTADGMQVVDVTFDADVPEVTQPGKYYATLRVRSNDPVNRSINVPVTMTVNVPATWGKLEGTVRGLGYCDANPAPLKEAEIEVYDFTGTLVVTLTTDAQGRYSYWLDEAHSPLTVTATYTGYQAGQVTGVIITGQQTTTVDFDLRWLRPCLNVEPATLSVTLDIGLSATLPLTLNNTGAGATAFEIQEHNVGFVPMSAGTAAGRNNSGEVVSSRLSGAFPLAVGDFTLRASSPVPLTCVTSDPSTGFVYAQQNQGYGFYRYDPFADSWTALSSCPIHSGNNGGAVFLKGKIYTIYTGNGSQIGVYDVASNSWTTMPNGLGMGTGNITTDGRYIYAAVFNTFMRYDPSTNSWSNLASPPFQFERWGGLSYFKSNIYGHRGNGYSEFAKYDIASNTWTLLSNVPGGAVLGSAIDPTGKIYYAYGSYWGNNWYAFDITRETWSVATIPFFWVNDGGIAYVGRPGVSGMYLVQGEDGTGFARFETLPLGGDDIPWLTENPVTGTLPADSSVRVDVIFDAGVPEAAQPGEYLGTLFVSPLPVPGGGTTQASASGSFFATLANKISKILADSRIAIPVTMTVKAPSTWGKLIGTVLGLGHCDTNPAPLENATVFAEGSLGSVYTMTTDVNGYYQRWLDGAESPYTLTVSYPGYLTGTASVMITAQQTTTVDFDLRLDAPCLGVDPQSLETTLGWGMSATLPLTLSNTGARDLDFIFASDRLEDILKNLNANVTIQAGAVWS